VRRKTISFDTVRKLAGGLAGVAEGTAYGSPALKVRGKMFACMATHRSAEPNTLAVRIPFKDRDELIAADPDTFYLKDHYVDYACVLARLDRIHPDALRDLLGMGWRFISSPQKVRRPRRSARSK
jgi:hypothetical protein